MKQSLPMAYDGSRCAAIVSELRQLIRTSRPDQLTLSECALVRKYGIARGTAGKVLNILKAEGLVERQRGRQTRICSAEPVTLLIPCPDFLLLHNTSAENFRNLYAGILRGAQERGVRIETIAVSRNNDRNTMDYSLLDAINSNSMLIVLSTWFDMLFPLLYKHQAQVLLIYKEFVEYGFSQFTRRWHKFVYSDRNETTSGLEYPYQCGCRRIGIVSSYLLNYPHLTFSAYVEWVHRHNLPEIYFELKYGNFPAQREAIGSWCRAEKCDALVVNGTYWGAETVQKMLGVPPEVKVFGGNFTPGLFPDMKPFPYSMPPYETMGYDAVELLTKRPRPAPDTCIYSGQFENLTLN